MSTAPSNPSLRASLGATLEDRVALLAPARRLRFALTRELLERHAHGRPLRVLDAGCGDGLLALGLAQRQRGWGIVGYDLRDELLVHARERARQRDLANIRFARVDLTEPLPEHGFDAVLAIECLEEISDDARALEMLAAALKPGGILIAHVPEECWRPVLPSSSPIWRDELRHGYSAGGIAQLLRGAGLEAVDTTPTDRTLVMLAQELRDRIKQRPLALRALAFPAMAAAAGLERAGATWGRPRALIAVGTKHGP